MTQPGGDSLGFQRTNLEPERAIEKLNQVDQLLEDFNTRMVNNARELQALVDNKAASGNFVVKFAARWTDHIDPMFAAWHRLVNNGQIARSVYDTKIATDN